MVVSSSRDTTPELPIRIVPSPHPPQDFIPIRPPTTTTESFWARVTKLAPVKRFRSKAKPRVTSSSWAQCASMSDGRDRRKLKRIRDPEIGSGLSEHEAAEAHALVGRTMPRRSAAGVSRSAPALSRMLREVPADKMGADTSWGKRATECGGALWTLVGQEGLSLTRERADATSSVRAPVAHSCAGKEERHSKTLRAEDGSTRSEAEMRWSDVVCRDASIVAFIAETVVRARALRETTQGSIGPHRAWMNVFTLGLRADVCSRSWLRRETRYGIGKQRWSQSCATSST